MKVTVRQISTASKRECTFYLKLEWTKDLGAGFVVVLCDGISAWSGEVSEEDVTREAQEMEMPRERYVQELELALTEEGQTAQKYSFHLTPEKAGGPKLQLFYDKVESDISFKLGVVELLPVPEPTKVIRELISYGLERSTHVQVENHHLHEENQRLKSEQEHITSELERYVRQKETLEKDLYSRFVLVLNEKKAKIRTFQETIKQLQDTIEAEKQRLNSEAVGCVEYRFAGDEPEEENYYGSTTDEEGPGDPKLPPAKLHNKELLAKNPLDDRLNDMTDVAPSRKRRCRHLQQLKSQTKKAALEQHKSSRNELHQEAKAEVSQLPAVQHAQVSPDPDDLFDDI
ncbi:DNA repair protein XRCC4 isoform X1 [Electrophorus electricus]|uniref:DNA repair protein XRCC4 n=1 Tax=Electrophorus electricus TaxID=8005 RepID=A0A4W4H8Q4_ELEEL|nr:DNA repair protein XRCC4 isoform X1 [Electrophorus electricus]XP_026887015.2 DNA repair protein XRCC4 isoform X1 [Electrophorus electricus]XP_026887016.2 DNA repair protein XRCC4 isoform X1 [Electrophorus electricus]XP_026887017.2 DNA repair protein XRCC4 isoform X1 [Electrophorus electricus]